MNIQTKLNVGDKFWIMTDNKPREFIIDSIEINYHEDVSCYTKVPILIIYYKYRYIQSLYKVLEEEVFLSKEDLIKNL